MKQELAVRRYTMGGEFIRVDKHNGLPMAKIKAFVNALLNMGKLFSNTTMAPTNPCNVSVRGPDGKFVKWK